MSERVNKVTCVICTIYILFLLCVGANFVFAQEPSEVPAPPQVPEVMGPAMVEHVANFIYTVYNGLTKALSFLLEQTIFKVTCSRGYYSVDSNLTSGTINEGRSTIPSYNNTKIDNSFDSWNFISNIFFMVIIFLVP